MKTRDGPGRDWTVVLRRQPARTAEGVPAPSAPTSVSTNCTAMSVPGRLSESDRCQEHRAISAAPPESPGRRPGGLWDRSDRPRRLNPQRAGGHRRACIHPGTARRRRARHG
jgi:hypothetical protein